MDSRARRSAISRGAVIALLGKASGQLLNLVAMVIAARILGPANYGVFAVGWVFLRVLLAVGTFGQEISVQRFGARDAPAELRLKLVGKSLAIAAIVATFLGILLIVLAGFVSETVFRKPSLGVMLTCVAASLPFAAVLRVAAAASRLSLSTMYAVLTEEVIRTASFLGLTVLLLVLGLQLRGMGIAMWASYFVACLSALAILPRSIRKGVVEPEHNSVPATPLLLAHGAPVMLSAFAGVVALVADRVVVGTLLTEHETGIYAAASQLTTAFALILGGFNLILSPILSRAYDSGDFHGFAAAYSDAREGAIYLALVPIVVVTFCSRSLLEILYGPDFVGGSSVLLILGIGAFFSLWTGGVGVAMLLSGLQKIWMHLSITILVLNLIADIVLVNLWGIVGAAIATTVSAIFLNGCGLLVLNRRLGKFGAELGIFRLSKFTLAAILFGLVADSIANVLSVSGLSHIFAVTLGASCAVLLNLRVRRVEVIEIFRTLRNRSSFGA